MIAAVDAPLSPDALPSAAPSPLHRVIYTFTAPSKAFSNLGAGRSWWLPFLLSLLIGYGFIATIQTRLGWDTVARNNLAQSPKQQARLEQAPVAQQEQQIAMIARITRTIAYVTPVIAPLIVGAIVAGVLLSSFNFLLGGHARFGPLFAVYFFSSLPLTLRTLLVIGTLLTGINTDAFQINNAVGSNPAFYLGPGTPHWMSALLSWFDVFLIWQLVLLTIGGAIVAKVSRGKAAGVVFGLTALCALIATGVAMAS